MSPASVAVLAGRRGVFCRDVPACARHPHVIRGFLRPCTGGLGVSGLGRWDGKAGLPQSLQIHGGLQAREKDQSNRIAAALPGLTAPPPPPAPPRAQWPPTKSLASPGGLGTARRSHPIPPRRTPAPEPTPPPPFSSTPPSSPWPGSVPAPPEPVPGYSRELCGSIQTEFDQEDFLVADLGMDRHSCTAVIVRPPVRRFLGKNLPPVRLPRDRKRYLRDIFDLHFEHELLRQPVDALRQRQTQRQRRSPFPPTRQTN